MTYGNTIGYDDAEVVNEEDNTKRNWSCYVCPWRDECEICCTETKHN